MPHLPSFNYYAELQLESTASSGEITSSYRRLALLHHPDKNPDNQEESTALFQRLQLAYETLSDPAKRARYDRAQSRSFEQDDESLWKDWDDEDDEDAYRSFFSQFDLPFAFFFASRFSQSPPAFSRGQRNYEDPRANFPRRSHEEEIRERVREEQRKAEEASQKAKKEAEAAEAAERAAENAKAMLERRRLQDQQRKKQEERWADIGAISKDQRILTCLHSDLCQKVQHNKKFKCTACSAKRGMTAFECPCCSAFLCQLCVTNFSDKRKKLEEQEQKQKRQSGTQSTSVSVDEQPDTAKHIVKNLNSGATAKPATAKPATEKSAKQFPKNRASGQSLNKKSSYGSDLNLNEPDEDNAPSAQAARFASENLYSILVDDDKPSGSRSDNFPPDPSTHHHSRTAAASRSTSGELPKNTHSEVTINANHKSDSVSTAQPKKKKIKNKKIESKENGKENVDLAAEKHQATAGVTMEPKVADATPVVVEKTKVPSSPACYTFSPNANNTFAKEFTKGDPGDTATVKPQGSRSKTAPSCQQEDLANNVVPRPGATRGFLRTSNPKHKLTTAMLLQAMEKFGAVRKLKITNKSSGIGHVEFATPQGLLDAMVASPVFVSDQVTVSLVELQQCEICGKVGHVSQSCRTAKIRAQN